MTITFVSVSSIHGSTKTKSPGGRRGSEMVIPSLTKIDGCCQESVDFKVNDRLPTVISAPRSPAIELSATVRIRHFPFLNLKRRRSD